MAPENNTEPADPIETSGIPTTASVPTQPQQSVPLSSASPQPVQAPPPMQPSQPPTPTQPPMPQSLPSSPSDIPPVTPPKVRRFTLKKYLPITIAVLILIGALFGAYMLGKSKERIIIQAPEPQPINLPPQAIVVTNCKPGRGKQYILPKDIPLGPVYDVVNDKVIAVEYNFKASDLFVDGNKLSDTLIPFFKGNYKTEYFLITPGKPQTGQSQAETPVNVAIFVVPKDVVSKITCDANNT